MMTTSWRLFLCLLTLTFLFGCSLKMEAFQVAPLEWESLTYEGVERDVAFYIPDSLSGPAPLVVLLHGGGGSVETTWRRDYGQTWRQLADEHGFVVMLPQGRADLSDPESHHWNDCRTGIVNPDVATSLDDSGFIRRAIQRLDQQRVNLDESRLYATGASNGGMMTFRLAFELGNFLAAGAAIIANLPDPSECDAPVSPIPILIMNGTADPLIPHEGGCVANPNCRRGEVRSTADTVDFWVSFNGASTNPQVEDVPNSVILDQSTVQIFTYPNPTNGAEVVLYLIEGGGHTVPGPDGNTLSQRAVVGPQNQDIDGPVETWAFFSKHSR